MDKSQVNVILRELKSIRKSQDRMQGTQVEILQRVTNMESEIAVLKSDVQEMKNEQVVMLQKASRRRHWEFEIRVKSSGAILTKELHQGIRH